MVGVGNARLVGEGNTGLVLLARGTGVSVAGYLQAESRIASRRIGAIRRR